MNIQDAKDGHIHVIIRDVPIEIWESFQKRSEKEMPEQGEKAGISSLSEMMFQAVDNASVRNVWITDLPKDVYAAFAGLTGQLKLQEKPVTPEEFFILQFKAAMKDYRSLAILYERFLNAVAPDGCKRWGISNIKTEAYEKMAKVLMERGFTPEQFLEALADAAMKDQFTLGDAPNGNIQRQPETKDRQTSGDNAGVGQYASRRREVIARSGGRGKSDSGRPNGNDEQSKAG